MLEELRGLTLYYSPNEKLESWFAEDEDDETGWFGWAALKYFLYEYEEHRAGRDGVKLKWKVLEKRELDKSIEHILPQTATDPYWKSHFTKPERERYLNDLGNLCITAHNGSLSNKSFTRKCGAPGDEAPCYANSQLVTERELAAYAEWTPATVLARRAKIVQWALGRWKVEGAPRARPDDDDAD